MENNKKFIKTRQIHRLASKFIYENKLGNKYKLFKLNIKDIKIDYSENFKKQKKQLRKLIIKKNEMLSFIKIHDLEKKFTEFLKKNEFFYKKKNNNKISIDRSKRYLFICVFGESRSRYFAERFMEMGIKALPCGYDIEASIKFNKSLINWADEIILLDKHLTPECDYIMPNTYIEYYINDEPVKFNKYFIDFLNKHFNKNNSDCNKCIYYDKHNDACWSQASIYEQMTGNNCKYFEKKNKE